MRAVVAGIAYAVAVGDLNADGRPDVVAANYSYSTVSVLLNSSSGLGTRTDFGTGNCPGDGPNGVALADVNNDGKLDIVAGSTLRAVSWTLATASPSDTPGARLNESVIAGN